MGPGVHAHADGARETATRFLEVRSGEIVLQPMVDPSTCLRALQSERPEVVVIVIGSFAFG